MNVNADLLRLLEPTVRPSGAPGAQRGVDSAKPPIEQRSFESLLDEARDLSLEDLTALLSEGDLESTPASAETSKPVSEPDQNTTADLLKSLSGLDRIENASLRSLVQQSEGMDRG